VNLNFAAAARAGSPALPTTAAAREDTGGGVSRRGRRRYLRRRLSSPEEGCRARGRRGGEAELGGGVRSSTAAADGSNEFAWVRRCSGRIAAACDAVTTEIERGQRAAALGRGGSGGGARAQGGDARGR
jgi:hypothetical protein